MVRSSPSWGRQVATVTLRIALSLRAMQNPRNELCGYEPRTDVAIGSDTPHSLELLFLLDHLIVEDYREYIMRVDSIKG